MITHLAEIRSELVQNGGHYFKDLPINFVYIGGSVARGEVHEDSDLDLFISVNQYSELDSKDRYKLMNQVLESLNPLKIDNIDVQILQQTRLDIQLRVFREGICIYDLNSEERTSYLEDIMNRGFDFEMWLKHYVDSALEA